MYTRTSKQILGPLAESVSALILIISDAEVRNKPTPDLSDLSRIIVQQIERLLTIAQKMAQQDSKTQEDMTQPCAEVSRASQLLVQAAQELRSNAFSPQGRQMLLDAVKGILSGTTGILDASDDADVRKILQSSSQLRQYCQELKQESADSPDEFTKAAARLSQAVFHLSQLSTKRIGELLTDWLQIQLKDAINILVRESPLMIQSCKVYLVEPKQREHRHVLLVFLDRLVDASKRIDVIVQTKGDNPTETGQFKNLLQKRRQLEDQVLAQPFDQTDRNLLKEYSELSQDLVQKLQSFLTPETQDLSKSVATACQELLQLPMNGEQSNHDAHELERVIQNGFDILESVLPQSLVSQLQQVFGQLQDPNQTDTAVSSLLQVQDPKVFQKALSDFNGNHQKLDQLVSNVLQTLDPRMGDIHDKVKYQNESVQGLAQVVEANAVVALQHPNDQMVQEAFRSCVDNFASATKELKQTTEQCFTAPQVIEGTKDCLNQQLSELLNGQFQTLSLCEQTGQDLIALARRELENTDDPNYKQLLQEQIQSVSVLLPNLIAMAHALSASQNLSESDLEHLKTGIQELLSHLNQLSSIIGQYKQSPLKHKIYERKVWHPPLVSEKIQDLKQSVDRFADLVQSHTEITELVLTDEEQKRLQQMTKEDDELRALTKAINQVVISKEEQPQLLSPQEAELDPLKAAGQELKVEASVWSDENEIVKLVKQISVKFLELSEHHHKLSLSRHDPQSKKAFIQTAQAIMVDVGSFVKQVQPLVDDCTDKRLQQTIKATLARISTLSQQLKIIAAVKASAPMDKDKGQQLVTSAQNLVSSIKTALRECISCTIRTRTQSVQFKRVVY
ncbi:Vinculin/alpha-catenin, partial [Gorgonomyces haynaldii]